MGQKWPNTNRSLTDLFFPQSNNAADSQAMVHTARRKGMSAKAMGGEGNQRELRFYSKRQQVYDCDPPPANVIALHVSSVEAGRPFTAMERRKRCDARLGVSPT
jgi:hypothetical protein